MFNLSQQYGEISAQYYDYFSTGTPGDEQFYLEEAVKAGSPVLELGAGTIRITIPIAQAGIEITGLDNSPYMLKKARNKISTLEDDVRKRITLIQADMRSFTLDRKFQLVIIPFRAFLHLLTVEDQRGCLTCIREHLSDDGLLIMNNFDPDPDMISQHSSKLGTVVNKIDEFILTESGNKVIVFDTRKYDQTCQTVEGYFIFEEIDSLGQMVSKSYIPIRLRYFFRYEMQHLLELCGFKIQALYGNFQRGPFQAGGEQIWVAVKQ